MARFISSSLRLSFNNLARKFHSSTRRYLTGQGAQEVSQTDDQCLVVKWDNGSVDKYPYLYLRDNCRCPQCFQEGHMSRTIYAPKSIDLDVTADFVDVDDNQLSIKWNDGHFSVYPSHFLKHLRYKMPGEGHPPGILKKGTVLWGKDFAEEGKLPIFDFEKLLKDDHELYNWLVTLAVTTGIAKLVNIPTKRNQLKMLGEKVGYLTSTNYGQEFDIRAYTADSTVIGYTSGELAMHSDYTFCHYSPGVAMLHCLQQAETIGGANHLVDALHAAHLLYEEDKDLFYVLTRTPIAYRNIARTDCGSFHTTSRRKIISLNDDGKVDALCYSDEFRDAHMPVPPQDVKSFYRAYYRFSEFLNDDRTSFWYKMKPGEAFTLNNHRVLHGRSAYADTDVVVRLLRLAYLDWDCIHSKIRRLAEQQGIECPVE